VADILSAIDGISGQVDQIARDATAEAVREGSVDRPLAVLADEACRLAKQSATLAKSIARSLRLLNGARFVFRTLEEARALASMVASVFPDPKRVEVGISELMLNAVEHGNLEISYEEKSRLLASGSLEHEVARRIAILPYAERYAVAEIRRTTEEIQLVIHDQGPGFDWRPYLEFSQDRACDAHGRGIATARLMCFSRLEYRGNGNEVLATVRLAGQVDAPAKIS
jgi:anti-sigma regulatory factor (Ser/Thr protein kinase)